MGHERVGILPKSIRWRTIVNQIAGASLSNDELALLTSQTLENVRSRLNKIQKDSGVKAALKFLIALPNLAALGDQIDFPFINIKDNPSPLILTLNLRSWIEENLGSLEYAEIAQRAVADVLGSWNRKQNNQLNLFVIENSAEDIWIKAANGAGFSEVARLFFAGFTERYLKYFLEREASAVIPDIEARDHFSDSIHEHVDIVTKHAFETALITQSFAAGWFNKHAKGRIPSDREIEGFLSLAFGKIREELLREAMR
jgi:hypothetical protein